MSIRTDLNGSQPNSLSNDVRAVQLGEMLSYFANKATPTQTGVVPSANVATLAAIPVALFQVNATAGTVTGVKTLRKGVVGTDVPATGECVWQVGTTKVAFAAADAVTAASFTYSLATDLCSLT